MSSAICFNLDQSEPITRRQILDSSKLKEFADNNFKFNENGSKLSKWVENIVGKGKIARYEQFLLFPQCFKKGSIPRDIKRRHCVGMGEVFLSHFDALKTYRCGKHHVKRRNCLRQAISPFLTVISTQCDAYFAF